MEAIKRELDALVAAGVIVKAAGISEYGAATTEGADFLARLVQQGWATLSSHGRTVEVNVFLAHLAVNAARLGLG